MLVAFFLKFTNTLSYVYVCIPVSEDLASEWLGPITLSSSTTVSANPTTYIATATALAKAKIKPIAPPNSGPRLLEIK